MAAGGDRKEGAVPIVGLTHSGRSFPQIGELRKGDKRPANGGIGKDLTYFRFTSDMPDVVAAFHAAYPQAEPRAINVFLPHSHPDQNWEAWYESYVAGGLVHRCDGRHVVLYRSQEDGEYYTPEPGTMLCPYHSGERPRTKADPGCEPAGRLKVVIPELERLAFVMALTGSIHDIRNIDQQLRELADEDDEGVCHRDLKSVPCVLRRRMVRISTPEVKRQGNEYVRTGRRLRREKWLLCIEAAPEYVAWQLAKRRQEGMPALEMPAVPALPDGSVLVNGETGEIIEESPPVEVSAAVQEPARPHSTTTQDDDTTTTDTVTVAGHELRPLSAAELRIGLRRRAGWVADQESGQQVRLVEGEPVSEAMATEVTALLGSALWEEDLPAGEVKDRISATIDWLFGVGDVDQLFQREAAVCLSWLSFNGNVEELHPAAPAEATAVFGMASDGEAVQAAMDLENGGGSDE